MAAVAVQIRGTLYDLTRRTSQQVVLMGEASLLGLGIGGGPIIPPEGGGGEGIWGPTDPRPSNPISGIPGLPGYEPPKPPDHIWGPTDPRPTPPIYLPPEQVPPNMKPPQAPPAGTTAPVPGNWPTSEMVPPEYVVFNYPGYGPIYVAPPPHAEPAQS